jgi:four helix bundle protein
MVKREYDLERRTLVFAKSVLRLCKKLPGDIINREIVSQLIRSSGSVGANYREANDALSKKDFNHRIKITRKEAKETEYWLELLREGNPGHVDEINELLSESIELKKILSSIADKASRALSVVGS